MRVESSIRAANGGYIHRGTPGYPVRDWVRLNRGTGVQPYPMIDAHSMWVDMYRDTPAGVLALWSINLGVNENALRRLGFAEFRDGVMAIPMRTGDGKVVGIRLRSIRGDKWAMKGSKQGLFIPVGETKSPVSYWLVICEGPTDTAAMLSLGFDAIGRPSCRGCVDHVREAIRGRDVVILADDDGPGHDGAKILARKMIYTNRVRFLVCPGHKDARAWASAADRDEIACVIDNAMPV